MDFMERKYFTFVSKEMPEDSFSVVKFKGVEGISRLYQYDILLASEDPDIDLKAVMQSAAIFTIHHEDEAYPVHGILSQFEQLRSNKCEIMYFPQHFRLIRQ